MPDPIRIGTRESKLAVWQAERVAQLLAENGIATELVFIRSEGDVDLTTPLYEMGVQGIFTRSLDIALLDRRVDIAVHSFKDIPTMPAQGLSVGAILKRGNPYDVLVSNIPFHEQSAPFTIATSSTRRKAQWLHRFPGSTVESLRGNIQTRIGKLQSSHWNGAIFAAAGLERLGLTEQETGPQQLLDWMIPAPAQGAIAVVCREQDPVMESLQQIDDADTRLCTLLERDFLRLLQGGCSTPISALAQIQEGEIIFTANITAPDGGERFDVSLRDRLQNKHSLTQRAVDELKQKGATKYIAS